MWIDLLKSLHLRKEVPSLNPMHSTDTLTLTRQNLTRGIGSDPRLPFPWATRTARLQASAAAVRASKPAVVGRQELGLPYITTGLYGSSQWVQWKALIPDFRFFCETVILFHPEPFNGWHGPPVTPPSSLVCCTFLSLPLLKVGEYQSVQSLRFWFNSNNTLGFPEASW